MRPFYQEAFLCPFLPKISFCSLTKHFQSHLTRSRLSLHFSFFTPWDPLNHFSLLVSFLEITFQQASFRLSFVYLLWLWVVTLYLQAKIPFEGVRAPVQREVIIQRFCFDPWNCYFSLIQTLKIYFTTIYHFIQFFSFLLTFIIETINNCWNR